MENIIEAIIPVIPVVLIALTGLVLGWIKGKGWLKEGFLVELETDISAVVNETYQEYVKERKKAAEDGKLTEEEKATARNIALAKLKELGKKKGKEYASEHLIPVALDLIEKVITKKKSG
jgi:hypothetical protein